MILRQIPHLEDDTREKIAKLQQKHFSGEINQEEYEEKYESLMTHYRLETQLILDKR